MQATITRTWKSYTPWYGWTAGAGTSRIYFRSPETGELCYRTCSWNNGRLTDYGDGVGIDHDDDRDLTENGKTYPRAEFRS